MERDDRGRRVDQYRKCCNCDEEHHKAEMQPMTLKISDGRYDISRTEYICNSCVRRVIVDSVRGDQIM